MALILAKHQGGDVAGVLADSMVPKHAQLRDVLLRRVRDELSPGDAMSSERDLMKDFGLSRATVRRAIGELVNDGVLVRTPGKGTFVARTRVESQLHLASFTDDMRRRGFTPTTLVLGCELLAPPADAMAFLGEGIGGRHWRLERLRLADGVPMAHELGWYNASLLPHLGDEELGSIYQLLRDRHQLVIDRAEQKVFTQLADAHLARLLQLSRPAPVLSFVRSASAAGRPVEHVTSHYRGDRYSLQMSLDSSMPPTPGTH